MRLQERFIGFLSSSSAQSLRCMRSSSVYCICLRWTSLKCKLQQQLECMDASSFSVGGTEQDEGLWHLRERLKLNVESEHSFGTPVTPIS
jgi:hypothetical protein